MVFPPVNSGLHLPLSLLLSGRENGPALSMEVLTVIAIGVLVRVALVAALGFLFSSRGVEGTVAIPRC